MTARRKAIGVHTQFVLAENAWPNYLKLNITMFSFTPARPISSMAEFVGPIIPKKYNPLTPNLLKYLNAHRRVAYIAFGQVAVHSEENIEVDSFDGFLWATVNSLKYFTTTITTSSGNVYQVQDMFDYVNPHALMINWAPQTAVLLHTPTILFVSHGVLGSWYESMYAGTPMIMFPFFGDQFGNALMIERNGLGALLKDDASFPEAINLFKTITEDKDGKIKKNVKRMQTLTQIRSKNGVIRDGDIIKDVVNTHIHSKLPHHQSIKNNMFFSKSQNLDLYVVLVSAFILSSVLAAFGGIKVYKCTLKQQKIKAL